MKQETHKRRCDEFAAAECLDVSVATLRDWRTRKRGPVYAKFGKAVRYPITELEQFAEASRVRMAACSSFARMVTQRAFPTLPLRAELAKATPGTERFIPEDVLDATGYGHFLDAALAHGEAAIREFRGVLGQGDE